LNLFEKILIRQDFILSIFLVLSSYVLYFLLSQSNRIKKRFARKFGKEKTKIHWILFQRGLGIILYGFIPVTVVLMLYTKKIFSYGLSLANFTESLYWTLGLSVVIIPFSILNARNPSHQKKYPQIQINKWNPGLLLISAFSWIVYLFAYELLLRGILFFSCLDSLGLWPAVIINILIYAFLHLHKNSKEVIGSLFLGIVFCLITYKTGTVWAAFFTHSVLACSSEWASIRMNPEMKIILKGNKK